MRKFVAILFCAVLAVTQVSAQNRTVRGKVTEDGKKPVANASVLVKGSTLGTKTDDNGNYTIAVPANARVLSFTALNFEARTRGNEETERLGLSQTRILHAKIQRFAARLHCVHCLTLAENQGFGRSPTTGVQMQGLSPAPPHPRSGSVHSGFDDHSRPVCGPK